MAAHANLQARLTLTLTLTRGLPSVGHENGEGVLGGSLGGVVPSTLGQIVPGVILHHHHRGTPEEHVARLQHAGGAAPGANL